MWTAIKGRKYAIENLPICFQLGDFCAIATGGFFPSLKISLKNVQGRVLDEEHHLAELQLELEPFQQALDTHR